MRWGPVEAAGFNEGVHLEGLHRQNPLYELVFKIKMTKVGQLLVSVPVLVPICSCPDPQIPLEAGFICALG